jgi:hypothetical protein
LRVGIAADSHGDWRALDDWASAHELDVVVHCGDAGAADSGGVLVLSARGNHEQRPPIGPRPIYVSDYDVVELAGLRWLFLGCCSYGGEVAAPPDELPAADVLISHEAPFNPHLGWEGHPIVRRVVEQVRPRWCFSGHWHHLARGRVGDTTCIALGADPAGWLVAEILEGELSLAG